MRFLPLLAFVAICFLLLMQLMAPPTRPRETDASWPINQPVPRVLLPLLPKDPTAASLASMPLNFAQAGVAQKGGYLVNLFASWCKPCIAELPQLEALAKEHGIIVVGVAWKDQPTALATFFSKYGRPYTQVLLDMDGKAVTELGSTAIPETFVVDGAGIIRKRYRGNLSPDHVQEIVAYLATLEVAAPVQGEAK